MQSTRLDFIQQLRNKLADSVDGPKIRAQLRKNEKTRLFDGLPPHFYSIFDDFFLADMTQLAGILRNANAVETKEHGEIFRYQNDRDNIINWCKKILRRGCGELLDDENNIIPLVLRLLGKSKDDITSRELICAYFAAINQCVLTFVADNKNELRISDAQFRAFIQFMNARNSKHTNNFSGWAQEVLDERVPPPLLDSTDKWILAGGAGLLLFSSLLGAGIAYANRNTDNNSPDNKINPPSRPSTPGFNN